VRTEAPPVPPPGVYRVDPVHTFAQFGVKHLLVGRVDGRFNAIEGEFEVTDDPERLFDRVDVRIEAASVDTQIEARDEDLRGKRFFDATRFPRLSFHSRTVDRAGEDNWTITGDLTIRDATRPATFAVTIRGATVDPRGDTRLGATATTELARPDFGLTTELQQESGPGRGPDVHVRLDIEAILQAASDS
jgi:polyisoprenoid-binding protein YceI